VILHVPVRAICAILVLNVSNARTHTFARLDIGTGAQRSNLIVGDTIVAVDGQDVSGLEPKAIVLKIAGKYKTEVVYTSF
jgi:C-terminal processing protease CtpA/Prc